MINERIIHTEVAAAGGGGTGNQEEGLILHLDANDVDSYDGDGDVWYDIHDHEYTPATDVSEHFNTVTYTGNGSTNAVTGLEFQPDLVWIKNRDAAWSHHFIDIFRKTNTYYDALNTDNTKVQNTSESSGVVSLDSNGFTLGSSGGEVNSNNVDYVAWCFKAGGAGVANTDGNISSQVSVNNDLGFSVIKYTSTNSSSNFGHGLDTAPELYFIKALDTVSSWGAYSTATSGLTFGYLNQTSAFTSSTLAPPTGSLIYVDNSEGMGTNYLTGDYICYAFTSKRGVSKVGSFIGTGASGNKIYTGFEPAFIMIKASSNSGSWVMLDNKRNPSDPRAKILQADLNTAEIDLKSVYGLDCVFFHRDGFSLEDSNATRNASNQTYIYYAVAKNTNETSLIPDTDLELHLDAADLTSSSTTWDDKIVSGNNGTLGNSTHDEELGDSVNIPATSFSSGNTIEFSSNPVHNQTVYSIETWVKFPNNTSFNSGTYITLSNHSGRGHLSGRTYKAGYTHGAIRDYIHQTNYVSTSPLGEIKPEYWHHYVSTRNGTSLNQYLDGNLVGSHTVSSSAPNVDTMTLGAYRLSSTSANGYFNGDIGQVRVYSTALSQAQIRQNYNFTKPKYPNEFHGDINGATWNAGGYFDFDGSNDYIDLGVYPFGITQDISFSFWIKPSSSNADNGGTFLIYVPAKNSHSNPYYSHCIALESGSDRLRLDYLTNNGSSQVKLESGDNTLTLGQWKHYVLTREGNQVKWYKDGNSTPIASTDLGSITTLFDATTGITRVGSRISSNHYKGSTSKLKVYNRALSTSEITALYNEGE